MIYKFSFFLGLILGFHGISLSQSIAWTYIADELSFGSNVALTSEGDILLSTAGDEHFVIKLSEDGDFIWNKNICFCDGYGVISSIELEDLSLLHITESGLFYLTNDEGDDPQLLLDLSEENEIEFLGVRDVQYVDEMVYVLSNGQYQGNYGFQKSVIDLQDYTFEQIIDTTGISFTAFDIHEDGSIVELVRNLQQTSVVGYDNDSSILFEQVISEGDVFYNDISILADGSIVAVGSESFGEFPFRSNGIVIMLDSMGNELWKRSYEHEQENSYGAVKIFTEVEEVGGSIQIGGTNGQMFFSDAHFLNLDKEGNTQWELDHHILGERDGVTEILPLTENSFLAVGTAGETDYIEPQRAYVMRLRGILDDVDDFVKEDFRLFPNPSFSELLIDTDGEWNTIEILDGSSRRVLESTDFGSGLDVSYLNPGTYFVRLTSEEFTLTKKWIKI